MVDNVELRVEKTIALDKQYAVFFAFITFLVLNESAASLRKISNAVWQVLS